MLLKNIVGILILSLILIAGFFLAEKIVLASTNINSTSSEHFAWNDDIGWIDFYNTNTITVDSHGLSGYASSSVGDISLDCHTTRNGNICATSNYQVTNDGLGNLSGYGWNDQYGWISFYCNNDPNPCQNSNYRVYIDSSGNFQNYAWNDTVGWISFNCDNYNNGCTTSNYYVNTSWISTSTSGHLDSTIYDTGVSGGAQINSILWHGSQPSGTAVRFQIATSNATSGPWSYIGTDGTSNTYYSTGPNASLKVDYTLHNNERYFRYRVTLFSDQAQSVSPRVDDIIINWSP